MDFVSFLFTMYYRDTESGWDHFTGYNSPNLSSPQHRPTVQTVDCRPLSQLSQITSGFPLRHTRSLTGSMLPLESNISSLYSTQPQLLKLIESPNQVESKDRDKTWRCKTLPDTTSPTFPFFSQSVSRNNLCKLITIQIMIFIHFYFVYGLRLSYCELLVSYCRAKLHFIFPQCNCSNQSHPAAR